MGFACFFPSYGELYYKVVVLIEQKFGGLGCIMDWYFPLQLLDIEINFW